MRTDPKSNGDGVSAHQAVVRVLKASRRPLTAKQIIDRVLATKGVDLRGLTPRATVSAQISNALRRGEIKRVNRGIYVKAA